MKPFTIDSYRAGKVPVTRSGETPMNFEFREKNVYFPFSGELNGKRDFWTAKGNWRLDRKSHKYDIFEKE